MLRGSKTGDVPKRDHSPPIPSYLCVSTNSLLTRGRELILTEKMTFYSINASSSPTDIVGRRSVPVPVFQMIEVALAIMAIMEWPILL